MSFSENVASQESRYLKLQKALFLRIHIEINTKNSNTYCSYSLQNKDYSHFPTILILAYFTSTTGVKVLKPQKREKDVYHHAK